MINNIRLKIIAGKIKKIPNFTQFLHEKCRLHNKTTRSRPAKPRPKPRGRGRGQNFGGLEDLTSLNLVPSFRWSGLNGVVKSINQTVKFL